MSYETRVGNVPGSGYLSVDSAGDNFLGQTRMPDEQRASPDYDRGDLRYEQTTANRGLRCPWWLMTLIFLVLFVFALILFFVASRHAVSRKEEDIASHSRRSLPFDCNAGFWNWERGWNEGKKKRGVVIMFNGAVRAPRRVLRLIARRHSITGRQLGLVRKKTGVATSFRWDVQMVLEKNYMIATRVRIIFGRLTNALGVVTGME